MKQQASWWELHMLNDKLYSNVRFKTLLGETYNRYRINEFQVDKVPLKKFLLLEQDRLPLIIGTQFGFFPKPSQIKEFYTEPRIIALLSKSALSGRVAGVSICLIPDNSGVWKVIKDFSEQQKVSNQNAVKEINIGRDFGFVLESGESLVIK